MLFCPTKSVWVAAIKKKYFATWSGLTVDAVNKYLDKCLASSKGHLKQKFQHSRSTKPTPLSPILVDAPRTRTNIDMTKIIKVTGQLSMDQTGRLPFPSSLGTKYFMVCYEYDANPIISISFKSTEGPELLHAYKELYNYLTTRGLKSQKQHLDNEASSSYKQTRENYKLNTNFFHHVHIDATLPNEQSKRGKTTILHGYVLYTNALPCN